jgi:hypothetical protein
LDDSEFCVERLSLIHFDFLLDASMQCWHFHRLTPLGTVTSLTAGLCQQVLQAG